MRGNVAVDSRKLRAICDHIVYCDRLIFGRDDCSFSVKSTVVIAFYRTIYHLWAHSIRSPIPWSKSDGSSDAPPRFPRTEQCPHAQGQNVWWRQRPEVGNTSNVGVNTRCHCLHADRLNGSSGRNNDVIDFATVGGYSCVSAETPQTVLSRSVYIYTQDVDDSTFVRQCRRRRRRCNQKTAPPTSFNRCSCRRSMHSDNLLRRCWMHRWTRETSAAAAAAEPLASGDTSTGTGNGIAAVAAVESTPAVCIWERQRGEWYNTQDRQQSTVSWSQQTPRVRGRCTVVAAA